MAWDAGTHRAITLARLKVSPPEVVHEALRDYAKFVRKQIWPQPDEELETVLLARNDPLINLGLAHYGASEEVVTQLYERGQAGSGDPEYDKGLRLACLANRIQPLVLFKAVFGGEIDRTRLRHLAQKGDPDEISVMLQNPSAGGILKSLYSGEAPFDEISDERHLELVHASIGNPRINIDESSVDGPDLLAWDIHKGIAKLLQTAPLDAKWLHVLYSLVSSIELGPAHSPTSGVREMLERWSTASAKRGDDSNKDLEGLSTPLSLVDEFRCLLAAVYGQTFENKKLGTLGSAADPDVALRCSYYGNASMTPEQMRTGHQRDGDVFVFAALLNTHVYQSTRCREVLEDMISGEFRYDYARRCEQLHKHRPRFDPRPASETGAAVLEDVIEEVGPSRELTALSQIQAQVATLQERISSTTTTSIVGFLIVLGVIYIGR